VANPPTISTIFIARASRDARAVIQPRRSPNEPLSSVSRRANSVTAVQTHAARGLYRCLRFAARINTEACVAVIRRRGRSASPGECRLIHARARLQHQERARAIPRTGTWSVTFRETVEVHQPARPARSLRRTGCCGNRIRARFARSSGRPRCGACGKPEPDLSQTPSATRRTLAAPAVGVYDSHTNRG